MYLSRTSLLTIALSSLASASPTEPSLLERGVAARIPSTMNLVDEIGWVDLADYEGDGPSPLTKRTPVDYCVATAAQTANCIALGGLVTAVAGVIAAALKSDSNNNDCSTHSGSIDNVNWKVSASGRNCDTTAQLSTIDGALTNYLRSQNDSVCNIKCIKLDHSGTWTGYVTIAPAGTNLSNYYCGTGYSFGNCGSN